MNSKMSGSIVILCAMLTLPGMTGAKGKPRLKGGSVTKENVGTVDGQGVDLYTLTNAHGLETKILTYGGIVVSLRVPDRKGAFDDVVLGFDTLDAYVESTKYFGALIGRYGNRIGKGRFTLNGVEYKLAINNGENSQHGGVKGFDKVVWNAKSRKTMHGPALELTYLSRDGEEGYPGNLSVKVIYTLTKYDELKIDYYATTDKDTVINLTNHSYFNLAGEGNGDILDHRLSIGANFFTPIDAGLIPTGEFRNVIGTAFDFMHQATIGSRIDHDDEQLKFGHGYDHNFVLNGKTGQLQQVATVVEDTTGRMMEVWTTEPGMQFYTGNFLDGTLTGKSGKVYQRRSGFCLETQHYPDAPNKPTFPSTVLKKGRRYRSTTSYRFMVLKDWLSRVIRSTLASGVQSTDFSRAFNE
jgi:aldose 1-epimerase